MPLYTLSAGVSLLRQVPAKHNHEHEECCIVSIFANNVTMFAQQASSRAGYITCGMHTAMAFWLSLC
jgi:hypothetical protein